MKSDEVTVRKCQVRVDKLKSALDKGNDVFGKVDGQLLEKDEEIAAMKLEVFSITNLITSTTTTIFRFHHVHFTCVDSMRGSEMLREF